MTADEKTIPLHRVAFDVCDLCLTAAGGECHVPGCVYWMQAAPVGSALAWLRERRAVTPHLLAEKDAGVERLRARLDDIEQELRWSRMHGGARFPRQISVAEVRALLGDLPDTPETKA